MLKPKTETTMYEKQEVTHKENVLILFRFFAICPFF